MKKTIWVSPNHNGGWRKHTVGKIDIIEISPTERCIERAKEIAERQDEEIKKQTLLKGKRFIIGVRNSYGRDPFPPCTLK